MEEAAVAEQLLLQVSLSLEGDPEGLNRKTVLSWYLKAGASPSAWELCDCRHIRLQEGERVRPVTDLLQVSLGRVYWNGFSMYNFSRKGILSFISA